MQLLLVNYYLGKGYTKITDRIKQALYDCILQHIQVIQSSVSNDYIRVSVYGKNEKLIVHKPLLQVPVWLIHNIMVKPEEYGGLK